MLPEHLEGKTDTGKKHQKKPTYLKLMHSKWTLNVDNVGL